jgi:hypothetical protein
VDAFRRHGLYYPSFHMRDDRWLKISALYWPRIVRLVPERYHTRDSVTARAFSAADPDFFYRLSPGDSVGEVGILASLAALGGGVHITHMSDALRTQLVKTRLALHTVVPWEGFRRPREQIRIEGLPYEREVKGVLPTDLVWSDWGGHARELADAAVGSSCFSTNHENGPRRPHFHARWRFPRQPLAVTAVAAISTTTTTSTRHSM